ncbi:MAG: hypothetical protein DRP35_00250 [Candidatus Zixiibacteriota bacterium]|nr:MAG: hypothetical protein DRP35_00250 [candidate division Zixibacteria bacterium]
MLSIEQFREITKKELSNIKFKEKSFEELKDTLNDNSLITADSHCNPKTPNLSDFKSNSETGYQRAIFNTKFSHLTFSSGKDKNINWLDLELPVELRNQSRKKCIDLIGKIDDKPIICELKYKPKDSKSNSDRPEYGIFELIIYYYLILCNNEKLNNNKVHHNSKEISDFNWNNIINEKPLLILAANKKYWENWFDKKTYQPCDTRDEILNLVHNLNKKLEINLCLFETNNIDLESDDTKYKGIDVSKEWKQITKI